MSSHSLHGSAGLCVPGSPSRCWGVTGLRSRLKPGPCPRFSLVVGRIQALESVRLGSPSPCWLSPEFQATCPLPYKTATDDLLVMESDFLCLTFRPRCEGHETTSGHLDNLPNLKPADFRSELLLQNPAWQHLALCLTEELGAAACALEAVV